MSDTKFTVNWKKREKRPEGSVFLVNKSHKLALPAPEQIETNEVHLESNIVKSTQSTSAKLAVAIQNTKNKVAKYAAYPVKYCYRGARSIRHIAADPVLIIGYIHVILNLFITISFIGIVIFLIHFLRLDVWYKIKEKREVMKALISNVKQKYEINKCDPSTRVPALQKQCAEWENIIRNGFSALNYTKIIIELVAGAIDTFISKVTYKTLVTVAFLMIFYLKYRK